MPPLKEEATPDFADHRLRVSSPYSIAEDCSHRFLKVLHVTTGLLTVHQAPHDYSAKLLSRGNRGMVWVAHDVMRVGFLTIVHCGVEDFPTVLPLLLIDANPEVDNRPPLRSNLVLHPVVLLRGKGHACRVNVVDVTADHKGSARSQGVSLGLLDRVACQVGYLRGSGHSHGHPLDLPQNPTANKDVVVLDQVGQEFCDLGLRKALSHLRPPLRSKSESRGCTVFRHPSFPLGDKIPSLIDSG